MLDGGNLPVADRYNTISYEYINITGIDAVKTYQNSHTRLLLKER